MSYLRSGVVYNIIHFCIYAIPAIFQEIKQEMHEKRMFRREKISFFFRFFREIFTKCKEIAYIHKCIAFEIMED